MIQYEGVKNRIINFATCKLHNIIWYQIPGRRFWSGTTRFANANTIPCRRLDSIHLIAEPIMLVANSHHKTVT